VSDLSILVRSPAPDEFGIVTEQRERREKFARYTYTPPVIEMPAEKTAKPSLEELVRAAVENYMGSAGGKKKIERAISLALTAKSKEWRNERLESSAVAARVARYPIDNVLEIASQITDVPLDALLGPTRTRKLSWARHFAMVLLHCARRDLSYPKIGKVFGNRDHTTVVHALSRQSVRRQYPECAPWYADPRAVAIVEGTEFAADKSAETEGAGRP
jgi:hypothetical protein